MNTRKLIEGLYRQKRNLNHRQLELSGEKLIILKSKSPDKKRNLELIEQAQQYTLDTELMIDELLIEFFGE